MNNKDFQKIFGQAKQAFQVGDLELAEKLTGKLLKIQEDLWLLHLLMGNITLRREKWMQAESHYKRSLELNPNNKESLNNLAILYRQQGDYKRAGQYIQQAMKDPEPESSVDLIYNRGNLSKAMGLFKQAIKDYRKVIQMDPNYLKAYNNLGTIYISRENWEKAANVYDKGLKIDPHNPNLLYNRALLYQNQKNWDQAEVYFEKALQSRPGWEDCQNNLAIVYQEKGTPQRSRKIYQEILSKDRNNPRIWNNMGVVLKEMGQPEEAEKCYQEALELAPDYKNASLNLNHIYSSQKDYAKALQEMNRLATLYPFDLEIRNEIGQALIRLNQLHEAEETFLHILERDPSHMGALKDLAELKIRQGDEQEGWKYLEKVGINHFLEDDEALIRVADAYRKNGNNAKAEELLRRKEDYSPGDPKVRSQLSRIYEEQERWEEALELIPKDNDQTELPRKIKLNLRQGKRKEALKDMDRLMSQQSAQGSAEDLESFREFLDLYEETSEAILQENPDRWEANLFRLSRSLRSMKAPDESIVEEQGPSLISQSAMEEENLTLLDIHAMEPVIEINEDREVLYLEDEEEDFSEIYTEVMEEEQRRQEKAYREKFNLPPSYPGYPPPMTPPQPTILPYPVPSQAAAPQVVPVPMKESSPIIEEEEDIPKEERPTHEEEDEGVIDFDDDSHPAIEEVDPMDYQEQGTEDAEEAEELDSQWEEESLANPEELLAQEAPMHPIKVEMAPPPMPNIEVIPSSQSLSVESKAPPMGVPQRGSTQEEVPAASESPQAIPATAAPPKPETPLDRKSLAGMMKYLSELSDSLPDRRKEEMIEREMPLKMEVVRSKLEGERSLLETASHYDRRSRNRSSQLEIDDEKLNNSLEFFKDMTHQYPDNKVSKTFDSKLSKLLNRIQKIQKLKQQ